MTYTIEAIGFVRSTLKHLDDAPRQGDEDAPQAWIEILPEFSEALLGIQPGTELMILSWLHLAQRDILQVHPRDDKARPLSGVFATRSQDRPNPIGLHRAKVLEIAGGKLLLNQLEAIDGTPIIDIKPVLGEISER